MKVTPHRLKDRHFDNWHSEVFNHWDYADISLQPGWREDWISFDCCLYLEAKQTIYCGVTSFNGEIFWEFDRCSGLFRDTGFSRVRDPYDAKFHRSLVWRNADACIYGAIALLHDIDRYFDAPGGAIVRYQPGSREIEKIAIPLPHIYLQSICIDQERDVLYGLTFTPERMIRFDLRDRSCTDLGPISSGFEFTQGETIALDDAGCAWSSWAVTRAWQDSPGPDSRRLCKFDPEAGRIRFYPTGLPRRDGSAGYEKLDGFFNLGTGQMYASGGNGSMYRIDTETGKAEWLFCPVPDRPSRLSSLRMGPDGAAYGVAGKQGNCEVIRFDPRGGKYESLGRVGDGEENCWQVHDVAITDDFTLFACENDNPWRSGYLWEIKL